MGKAIRAEDALQLREEARTDGKKVVFTNGVFDLLHVGHLDYLTKSKKMADLLIVGLNSDSSANLLKGEGRPLNSEMDRAELLSGFKCVDAVVIFPEETPLELIKILKPDFLVKGSDYSLNEIVGREFVESYGGKVLSIELRRGYSTNSLIEKISGGN
ncbi:MAG: D-glycero-beta-D-manno-heptose 1-phosphate adenylyltransferase [Candidatus Marinimicrobia bacterium]|nr:D-glycero-beta-D-manno-heptose 1-phosphate adenylyltransferase [Candidatus Neomarinimicrobiota bacterium]